MRTIEYRVTFGGEHHSGESELITVRARTINSGFPKALRRALEPLGNGVQRELLSLEFVEVV